MQCTSFEANDNNVADSTLGKRKAQLKHHCISMFSGGRDSTAAVARLSGQQIPQTLVTISSPHLVGINRVKKRLKELANILPADTEWRLIRQPSELSVDTSFYKKTCLPCHHSYVVVGAVTAIALSASRLSFGYAGYQKHWPEQTPIAIESLTRVLAKFGIRLETPVYGVNSKSEIEKELRSLGLDDRALEQKCMQQVSNVELDDQTLLKQIKLWESAIEGSMNHREIVDMSLIESGRLASFL
jgi:hypothetical protein